MTRQRELYKKYLQGSTPIIARTPPLVSLPIQKKYGLFCFRILTKPRDNRLIANL